MDAQAVLEDAFGRVHEGVHRLCEGLAPDALTWRPDPGANTIAWLVWHLARIGDAQVADMVGSEQLWTGADWAGRFGLPLDVEDTGYGHSPDDVARVRVEDAGLLVGYLDAVLDQTLEHLAGLDADDLDRVVDPRWDPPVTAGVRLVSIVDDQAQHVGQAAYVRGMYERVAGRTR